MISNRNVRRTFEVHRTSLPHLKHERRLMRAGYSLIAGIDEAGRGAWAGPVVAGAIILNLAKVSNLRKVNDSKQLTARQREALFPVILNACIAYGIGSAQSDEIDSIGILPATRLAMQRAIESLSPAPTALIIDAVKLPQVELPQSVFNFADSISLSVAAASILAKVTRDRMMIDLDARYPAYGFARHKGYGTLIHQAALQSIGPCEIHRQTFKPIHALLIDRSPSADRSSSLITH
jgi:ribonuclease HII